MQVLAVVGNLARDVVDGGPPRVGGAPYYAARALAVLRRPSRVVTKCSQEDRRVLLPPLLALGIPVSWQPAASTTAFTITYSGDERTMAVDELGEPWTASDAEEWLREALADLEWVHLGALLRSDFPPETLAALARGGRRLSLDGQGLVRAPHIGSLTLDGGFDPAVLEHVAVLKLSEEETLTLFGSIDEQRLAGLGVPEVVVTLSERGAIVVAGGRAESVPVERVLRDVDPTGAGDAFAIGYLAARSDGAEPVEAARHGNALAGEVIGGRR